MPSEKDQLLHIIKTKALKIGDFKLAHGGRSNFYLNSKEVLADPAGAYLTGRLILESIGNERVDAIGGIVLGAVPIATAVTVLSHLEDRPIPSFYVRKKPKGRGLNAEIEGYVPPPGSRVVIVEDVVTTGASTLLSIEKIEAAGCRVINVISLVDREEGGGEAIIGKGYPFNPLFTRSDLGIPA